LSFVRDSYLVESRHESRKEGGGYEAIRDYDSGKFVFAPTGDGGTLNNSFYGQAVIPATYTRKNWTDQFIFREWVSDYSAIARQPTIVLQRKPQ
jgi:hypothetical protein